MLQVVKSCGFGRGLGRACRVQLRWVEARIGSEDIGWSKVKWVWMASLGVRQVDLRKGLKLYPSGALGKLGGGRVWKVQLRWVEARIGSEDIGWSV